MLEGSRYTGPLSEMCGGGRSECQGSKDGRSLL
jgi:hypothetical protein